MPTVIIKSNPFDSPERLVTAIQNASNSDIEVKDVTDTEWEQGDACPECGNKYVRVYTPIEDIHRSENSIFEYMEHGNYVGPIQEVICDDCETTLESKNQAFDLPRR